MVFPIPDALKRRIRGFTDQIGIEPGMRPEIVPVIVVDAFNDVIPLAAPGAVLPSTLTFREFTFIWIPMGDGVVVTVPQATTDQSILAIPADSPYRYRVESVEVTMLTGTTAPSGASPVTVYLHPSQVDDSASSFHAFNVQFWGAGPRDGEYLTSTRHFNYYSRESVFEDNLGANFGWIAPVTRTLVQAVKLPNIWLAPGGALRVSVVPGTGAGKDLGEVSVRAVLTGVARG